MDLWTCTIQQKTLYEVKKRYETIFDKKQPDTLMVCSKKQPANLTMLRGFSFNKLIVYVLT